ILLPDPALFQSLQDGWFKNILIKIDIALTPYKTYKNYFRKLSKLLLGLPAFSVRASQKMCALTPSIRNWIEDKVDEFYCEESELDLNSVSSD
ncbi:MAG: hypothetical protein Q8K37_04220, partial [Alphaproteobacteria bacterium]|nr:hypothetical protein [Alphaproteobacteria bacterium]